MKRRVLGVLLGVVVLVLTMTAPVGADVVDGSEIVTVTIDMPDGSVQVIDTVFDIDVINSGGFHELELLLGRTDLTGFYRVRIVGTPGLLLDVVNPGGGGGICNICP